MTLTSDPISKYLSDLSQSLSLIPRDRIAGFVDLLWRNYNECRRVVFCGNGGSAATASHLPADFQKGLGEIGQRQWECMSIVDSLALVTAWSNDTSYENALAAQAKCWLRPGDMLVAFSGSGNSANVIEAVRAAKELGAITVGLSGFGGGLLSNEVDLAIVVDSCNMQVVEDLHMAIGHCAYAALSRRIIENKP